MAMSESRWERSTLYLLDRSADGDPPSNRRATALPRSPRPLRSARPPPLRFPHVHIPHVPRATAPRTACRFLSAPPCLPSPARVLDREAGGDGVGGRAGGVGVGGGVRGPVGLRKR